MPSATDARVARDTSAVVDTVEPEMRIEPVPPALFASATRFVVASTCTVPARAVSVELPVTVASVGPSIFAVASWFEPAPLAPTATETASVSARFRSPVDDAVTVIPPPVEVTLEPSIVARTSVVSTFDARRLTTVTAKSARLTPTPTSFASSVELSSASTVTAEAAVTALPPDTVALVEPPAVLSTVIHRPSKAIEMGVLEIWSATLTETFRMSAVSVRLDVASTFSVDPAFTHEPSTFASTSVETVFEESVTATAPATPTPFPTPILTATDTTTNRAVIVDVSLASTVTNVPATTAAGRDGAAVLGRTDAGPDPPIVLVAPANATDTAPPEPWPTVMSTLPPTETVSAVTVFVDSAFTVTPCEAWTSDRSTFADTVFVIVFCGNATPTETDAPLPPPGRTPIVSANPPPSAVIDALSKASTSTEPARATRSAFGPTVAATVFEIVFRETATPAARSSPLELLVPMCRLSAPPRVSALIVLPAAVLASTSTPAASTLVPATTACTVFAMSLIATAIPKERLTPSPWLALRRTPKPPVSAVITELSAPCPSTGPAVVFVTRSPPLRIVASTSILMRGREPAPPPARLRPLPCAKLASTAPPSVSASIVCVEVALTATPVPAETADASTIADSVFLSPGSAPPPISLTETPTPIDPSKPLPLPHFSATAKPPPSALMVDVSLASTSTRVSAVTELLPVICATVRACRIVLNEPPKPAAIPTSWPFCCSTLTAAPNVSAVIVAVVVAFTSTAVFAFTVDASIVARTSLPSASPALPISFTATPMPIASDTWVPVLPELRTMFTATATPPASAVIVDVSMARTRTLFRSARTSGEDTIFADVAVSM